MESFAASEVEKFQVTFGKAAGTAIGKKHIDVAIVPPTHPGGAIGGFIFNQGVGGFAAVGPVGLIVESPIGMAAGIDRSIRDKNGAGGLGDRSDGVGGAFFGWVAWNSLVLGHELRIANIIGAVAG